MALESRNDEPHSRDSATSQTRNPNVSIHEQAVFSWMNETDERRRKAILEVRDQGQTDSCYAFGMVDAMYASQYLSNGHALKGSEQDFLDFLHRIYKPPGGVELDEHGNIKIDEHGLGNSIENASAYIGWLGLLLDEDYEFKGKCQDRGDPNWFYNRPNARTLHATFTNVEDDHIFLVGDGYFGGFLRVQPVVASIYCTPSLSNFVDAQGGIYDHSQEEWEKIWKALEQNKECPYADHVLLIVGYGEEGGIEYYIGKNCWGFDWGHNGFIKLRRTCVEGLGGFFYPLPPITVNYP